MHDEKVYFGLPTIFPVSLAAPPPFFNFFYMCIFFFFSSFCETFSYLLESSVSFRNRAGGGMYLESNVMPSRTSDPSSSKGLRLPHGEAELSYGVSWTLAIHSALEPFGWKTNSLFFLNQSVHGTNRQTDRQTDRQRDRGKIEAVRALEG